MKYFVLFLFCVFYIISKSSDTIYVEDIRDIRYVRYMDSLKAYETGFSVAKNMADSIKGSSGSDALDGYFLNRFISTDTLSGGYFYNFQRGGNVDIGHISDSYRGMKNEAKFPWHYLETQYKRLDSLKVLPSGVQQGGELPNVYVYTKPATAVVYKRIKKFTVVDTTIRFLEKSDGKTRISYITKCYYSEIDRDHRRIDSIEKLDPITHEHLFY